MFGVRARAGVAFVASWAVLTSTVAPAAADDATICTKSYESSQIMKKNREYLSARRELLNCIRTCPAVVQKECGQWLEGLEGVIPSIVIHAEAAGEDRSDVRVEMDGKVLAQKIDGRGIELDPGQHDFIFSAEGFPSVRKNVVVHEGEQLRVIKVAFEKPDAPGKLAKIAPAAVPMHRPIPATVYVFGALAVAGGAGFAAFGLSGTSQRDRFESSCAPRCPDSAVDTVHQNLVMADISLGVGLGALAAGTILWLTRPSVPATDAASVTFTPTRTGATVGATVPF